MEERKMLYFKRNVGYTVGGRFNARDTVGFILNNAQPWIAVPAEDLRDFKMVNKRAFMEGLMVEIDEPTVDWETPNALTDEVIDNLLKSYLKLKSTVSEVTSIAILEKMLERAKSQNKSMKTIAVIQDRIEDVSGKDTISPQDMRGVS